MRGAFWLEIKKNQIVTACEQHQDQAGHHKSFPTESCGSFPTGCGLDTKGIGKREKYRWRPHAAALHRTAGGLINESRNQRKGAAPCHQGRVEREAEAKSNGIHKAIYIPNSFLKGVAIISFSCSIVDKTGYLLKSERPVLETISSCLFAES